MRVLNHEEMHLLDERIIKDFDIPQDVLMENAGIGFINGLSKAISDWKSKRYIIVCGPGNNGGDGFVIARHLISKDIRVSVILLKKGIQYSGAAKMNLTALQHFAPKINYADNLSEEEMKDLFEEQDVIIDALFGVGLSRNVEGLYKSIITEINQSGKVIASVDIPSGINSENGLAMGISVKSDICISMGYLKAGNLLLCDRPKLYLHALALSLSFLEKIADKYLTNDVQLNLPVYLPPRNPSGHKGTFGQAIFITGSDSYLGAPLFSSYSFLKSGGGYSRLIAPKTVCYSIAQNAPEVVLHPYQEDAIEHLSNAYMQKLATLITHQTCVVIGPGLSKSPIAYQLFELATSAQCPIIIDADGLSILSESIDVLSERKNLVTILTPHIGEMSRLINLPIAQIIKNPIEIAGNFAKKWKTFLILKGARTIIATPEGNVWINITGNDGMGTAGTGDILTGVIASQIGTFGTSIEKALRSAVYIHGMAGDLTQKEIGSDGMTAGDLMNHLPHAFRLHREKYTKSDVIYCPDSLQII